MRHKYLGRVCDKGINSQSAQITQSVFPMGHGVISLGINMVFDQFYEVLQGVIF